MTEAIFKAALFMDRVWREINHLSDAIEAGLKTHGIRAKYRGNFSHDDDVGDHRTSYEYRLENVHPRKRRDAQLVLYFDLARPVEASTWPYAKRSLLIIAYEAQDDDGWQVSQLAIRADGTFESDETRSMSSLVPDSGNRLLAWRANKDSAAHWWQRAWLFGMELDKLTGPDDAERNVIAPLVALLRENAAPDEAFNGTDVIAWPGPVPSQAR